MIRSRQSFDSASDLSGAILGFTQYAREHELNVGLQESLEALELASLGLITHKDQFRYALKSLYCCSEEEGLLFDLLFEEYWQKSSGREERIHYKKTIQFPKQTSGSVAMMGKGDSGREVKDAKVVTGANRTERLRRTDFRAIAEVDAGYMEKIIQQLVKQMAFRMARRLKRENRGVIDIRSTIRRNMGRGGNMIELVRRNKKRQKPRLILLLDVSGSMDQYSFYLLRFAYALRAAFRNVETFIFSTTLLRITSHLETSDIREVLNKMSRHVHNWSSGTRIGECFKTFNDMHAKRIMNNRSVVVVLSDGLDTGDPQLLADELMRIRRKTRHLVWLNPLKGSADYEPTARGMAAALPEIDTFRSAHNLDSLLELENFLAHV